VNNRRKLVIALGAGALVTPIKLFAQQPTKIPRIGYLTSDSESADYPRRDAFRKGLSALGYREGQNVVIDYRASEGRGDKLQGLANELRSLNVDVMFVFSQLAVEAAKKEMPNIPIVSITPDPVAAGFVASLARPGGNITGLATLVGVEIYGKYMQLLKEMVPKLTRVAVLSNPTNSFSSLALNGMETWARQLKLSLQVLNAGTPDDFEKVFKTAANTRVEGLVVVQDAMFLAHRKQLAELAAKYRLPAIYGIGAHVEAGGLMAYGANRPDMFRRAAAYVDKIIGGQTCRPPC
jgi:putative ABC transport system substrate-binding protein